jgi:hypothetical protein
VTGVRVHRRNSHDIAVMAIRQSGRGRPTDRPTERWQDKSREVRGGRSGEKGASSRHFARCAPLRDSLSARASFCKHTHGYTSRAGTQ